MMGRRYYPESRVEVGGFMALHYDAILDIVTLGRYLPFVRKAIATMGIEPKDKILDLGAGTGRNALLMAEHLSREGEVVGVDISEEMIRQFRKKCRALPNLRVVRARIDRPLPFRGKFDKVFISFTLHGFPDYARRAIVRNAYGALRDGGSFFILDYNEFEPKEMPFYLRAIFGLVECPYAFEFVRTDLKEMLSEEGFGRFEEQVFFGYIRLLRAEKVNT